MAKASIKTETVSNVTGARLDLTCYEVLLLRQILDHVGGAPSGARGVADGILRVLQSIDVPLTTTPLPHLEGNLHFED